MALVIPDMKTARLAPRRWSSQWSGRLANRATRGLAVLLDRETRLVGVAFLGRIMTAADDDGAGGEVVGGADMTAGIAGNHIGRETGGSGIALSQSGRSKRADAQDDSGNSRSKTSVHGTIHLGLRGLRRMAVGRDLFSDLDLGSPLSGRRAVSHPTIGQTFYGAEA